MAVAQSKTSPVSNTEGKQVDVDVFHIDQIPDAMDSMGWKVAPQLMRHWFSLHPAEKWTTERKNILLNADARTLKPSEYNDTIVKMDWALQYHQVKEKINEGMKNWNSEGGINLLRERLFSQGYVLGRAFKLGYTRSARELDATAQVNYVGVGSKLDTINDWFGAIGTANLKFALRGFTSVYERKNIFAVEAVGVYIKDTYDFVDRPDSTSEFLGIWGKSGVLSKFNMITHYLSLIQEQAYKELSKTYSGLVPIYNSDFRRWQDKHDSGGDFLVFSDVLWLHPLRGQEMIFL
ncbi:DUF6402 family protein [Dickeya dianthicola]|uniref:DUF6402 family protein n=1 Tax=Dickeya dianthicola TaxID=204039 RepID=UPI001F610242|nr:DUF6402 family protein [Dickeya dianthicola]MCI4188467.1 DUF6402 family protein [Dickeya dianthicola]